MKVTRYHSDGVPAAAALVNVVTTRVSPGSDDDIRGVLSDYDFFLENCGPAEIRSLRDWAWTLRPLFECTDLDDAVSLLNELMFEVPIHPHIADHDGRGIHIHYAPPGARLPHRIRAKTLFELSALLCDSGLNRIGACAASDCDRVYADSSPGGRRRFCSDACANRTNVATFRARRKTS